MVQVSRLQVSIKDFFSRSFDGCSRLDVDIRAPSQLMEHRGSVFSSQKVVSKFWTDFSLTWNLSWIMSWYSTQGKSKKKKKKRKSAVRQNWGKVTSSHRCKTSFLKVTVSVECSDMLKSLRIYPPAPLACNELKQTPACDWLRTADLVFANEC